MTETWKAVPGFPNYEASTEGRVRSLDREIVNVNGVRIFRRGVVLAQAKNSTGRYVVSVYRDGVQVRSAVHRVVCETYHGPPPEDKPWALHRNGKHHDNRPENLYWGTPKENAQDAIRHGVNPQLKKMHCDRGHEKTKENWYLRRNGRGGQCRECMRLRRKSYANNPPPEGSDLHGRPGTYSRTGCRCELCVEGFKKYRLKFSEVTLDENDPRHGLTGAFTYKCKCEICLESARAHYASTRAKRKEKRARDETSNH